MDVTTLMLYSAAYDIMSTGPKVKQLTFCNFLKRWNMFKTLQLEDSPASRMFCPLKTLEFTRFATDLFFAKVSTDMLRTLPAFFGILMARPHERPMGEWWGSRVRTQEIDLNGITMYTPGKLTLIPKMMRPWKRSLRLWRLPFLVSKLNFWEVHRSTLILIKEGTPRICGKTCMTSMTAPDFTPKWSKKSLGIGKYEETLPVQSGWWMILVFSGWHAREIHSWLPGHWTWNNPGWFWVESPL